MSKSVIIIGKGPSVLRSTKKLVDSFDEVAGCGRPVFKDYEQYVGNRLHYHFANKTGTPYTKEEAESLGIKRLICTAKNSRRRKSFIERNKGHDVVDPSTGVLAFDFFVEKEEYTKIGLIGFDLFQTKKRMYYFKNSEFDPAVNWLWENGTYDSKGRLTRVSGHNTQETYKYFNRIFDANKDKKFCIISSYPFVERENVEVL